jgi:DnaJ-domain-containing protein 1
VTDKSSLEAPLMDSDIPHATTGQLIGETSPVLLTALEDILRVHPHGVREIELINQLDEHYHDIFPKKNLADPLILFQTHFVIYNALYTLRDILWSEESGHLELGPVVIRLHPYSSTQQQQTLEKADHVRDYYLDFSNMDKTNRDSVDRLIRNFWEQMGVHIAQPQAFSVLGLSYPSSWKEIKTRYRQLAMNHHPDRGGDKVVLQEINEAYETLKKAFRNRIEL